VSYLAYHDTEAAPRAFAPHPQVELIFAPRPRSYAYSIGDPASPLNAAYAAGLAENMALFKPERESREGNPLLNAPAIFEYYLDGILFKSSVPPLPEVIAADMAQYRDAGVHTVHALLTGDRPWVYAPLNAALFAQLAWSPEQRPADLVATYAAARAPRAPAALAQAYSALEAAWRPALDRTPAEAAQRRDIPDNGDPVAAPPLDVLDYMAAPRPDSERRLEQLRAAEDEIAVGRSAWDVVMATAFADAPSLAAERAEWELATALLRFLTLRQQLYVLADRGAPKATLRGALDAAQAALDKLIAWANANVPPRARAGHLLMRGIFQLHLDHLADRQLAPPWQRVALRARRIADARALFADPCLVWELLRERIS
jgi:hypothetical protein